MNILGHFCLLVKNLRSYVLSENHSWPFFGTHNDIFINPKATGIKFLISWKLIWKFPKENPRWLKDFRRNVPSGATDLSDFTFLTKITWCPDIYFWYGSNYSKHQLCQLCSYKGDLAIILSYYIILLSCHYIILRGWFGHYSTIFPLIRK